MQASFENFVGVYENAFSKDFCNEVIQNFEHMDANGFVRNRQDLGYGAKFEIDDNSVWSGNIYGSQTDFASMNELLGKQFNNVYWNECYKHYSDNLH